MSEKLSFKQCLSHLYRYLKPNALKLYFGLLMVIVANLTYVIMPSVEGRVTTQLQQDITAISRHIEGAHIQIDRIVQILMILLGIFIVKISSQFLSAVLMTDAIQKTMADIRNAIEHKINRLPVSYFDQHKAGDLLSRITNDVETVSNALQQTLARVVGAVLGITLISFTMFSINRVMFGIVMAALPLIAFVSIFVVRKTQPVFDAQQEALSDLNSTVNEMYSGLNEIMIYNRQDYAMDAFEKANAGLRKKAFQAQAFSGLIGPLTGFITYMVIGICCFYGCLQVMAGTLMLGQLQAFIRYIWNINDPISQISQLSSAVQSAFSGMNRLFSFLDMEEENQTQTASKIEEVSSIDFDHVEFSYTDQPLMKDVTFHVKKNQTAAIVGHTGAGKTTLTNLLLRYYPIRSGSIKINGQDIRDLSFEDLRDEIGLVLQDPWMFEGTIDENLRYAKDGLSQEEIDRVITIARLEETISRMPDGLQTDLGENAQNLSQGEKQLLTIARALLKDPDILILDEATSSVDTRLEKKLQAAMEDVMKNRTCFVIAHRLSTILNADMILVMDHGDLVESGTHEELMRKNGAYAALYRSQFQQLNEVL